MEALVTWAVMKDEKKWRDGEGYWHETPLMPVDVLSLYLHVNGTIIDESYREMTSSEHPGHSHHASIYGSHDFTNPDDVSQLAHELAGRHGISTVAVRPAFWS